MADEERITAIERLASAHAAAYAQMLVYDEGVGGLGAHGHQSMFNDMLAWDDSTENDHADTVLWLIERLRANEAERDADRAALIEASGDAEVYRQQLHEARAEVAARDAVITQASTMLWRHGLHGGWEAAGQEAKRILSVAPESVLAARDAEKWWEGVTAQWEHRPIGNRIPETENPYQAGAE